MSRRLFAVLGASALLVGTAWAAFRTGSYKGTTGKGAGVTFTVKSSAVSNFTFSAIQTCSNGSQIANTTTISRIPIRKDQRFGTTSGTATVKGELSGSTAKGTLSVTQPSAPGGGRNCKTGSVAWSARRGGTSSKNPIVCSPKADFNGGDLQIDMSCSGEFDAFIAYVPRPATRADTSTAHLRCLVGRQTEQATGKTSNIANCSAQDGVKLRSGRVLVRFSDPATCADLAKTTVSALRVGPSGGEDGPFPLRSTAC